MKILMMLCLLLPLSSLADDLGQRILALRAQVEEAGNQLEESRKKRMAAMDVILQRQTEVEQQLRKERLKTLQLAEKRKLLASVNRSSSAKEGKELLSWAERLKTLIDSGIPFRSEERAEAVAALQKRIEAGRESPVSLASELWTLTERELKLAGSNEYRLMKIRLGEKEVDAEVARIGTLQALFRASNGEAGYAVRAENGWEWKKAEGSASAAIDRLIGRFQEKSYTGWFELPGISKGTNL